MITTKRSNEQDSSVYGREGSVGVGLLERKIPNSYSEFVEQSNDEDFNEAKSRMERNLDRILNYEKYESQDVDVEEKNEVAEVTVEQAVTKADDDIRPTSTTMQFGDGEIEQVYNDMDKQKEYEATGYKLNGKGKIVIALYAVAMAVVLALIMLNTGILAVLTESNSAKAQVLSAKANEYSALNQEINEKMSKDTISEIVENEYGMIIK